MNLNNNSFGENIEFKVKHRFAMISLNRIQRANALTLNMVKNLKGAIKYCQEEEKIRGIILSGNGSTFTTGMDLDYVDGSDQKVVEEYEHTATEIVDLLYNGKPSICAINGRAMGDGVAYALCCDYRIAMKNSFFWMPEIKSGIFPGAGTIVLMSKILGIPWTKRILMFAEKVNSLTASQIGLVDQIVQSQEELISEAIKKAKFLFTKNQTILNLIKMCANHLSDKSYEEARKIEKEALFGWIDQKQDFVKEFRKNFIS